MVLGTCTTLMRPAAFSSSFMAEKAVSSPPMVMRSVTPRRSSEITVFSSSCGSLVGFAREMPMCEPPRKWMREMRVDGERADVVDVALHEPLEAVLDAEDVHAFEQRRGWSRRAMTLLMPGAGPPPTRIASFLRCVMNHSCESRSGRRAWRKDREKRAPARRRFANACFISDETTRGAVRADRALVPYRVLNCARPPAARGAPGAAEVRSAGPRRRPASTSRGRRARRWSCPRGCRSARPGRK